MEQVQAECMQQSVTSDTWRRSRLLYGQRAHEGNKQRQNIIRFYDTKSGYILPLVV